MRSFNETNGTSGLIKRAGKKLLATTAMTAAGVFVFSGYAQAQDISATALPELDKVTVGSATYDYTSEANTLNIYQHDARTVAEYLQFNIGSDAGVRMHQNSSDMFVHIDKSENVSVLNGFFEGAGTNFIANRNGVLIGKDASIDMHGFGASTGDLNQTEFANSGKVEFSNFGSGKIVNQGTISVSDAGLAAFVSPQISNSGVINAKMGNVVLASGEKVTLDMYGDGLVEVAVDGELADALIENKGTIQAEGGNVQISASAAKNAVDNVINMDGVVDVSSVTQVGGKIILSGGSKGTVKVSGELKATGKTGGDIEVTGQNVVADGGAVLDASGKNGGGTIHFGGEFQGGGNTPTSDTAYVADTAILRSNADEEGNGGEVVVWSDDKTEFYGNIEAKGGATSGNGGLVEVSGAALAYQGLTDTTAANGNTGWLLLDPLGIRVYDGPNDNFVATGADPVFAISDGTLNGHLTTSNVLLATSPTKVNFTVSGGNGYMNAVNDDNITVEDGTDINTGANTLYFSTSTLNLYSTITGNVSGGVGSPLTPPGVTLKDPTTVNVFTGALTQGSIQQGVDVAASGATVNVGDGTYNENVRIGKSLTLQSENGRDLTTIEGISGVGALGTVQFLSGTSGIQLGDTGKGFTIVGIDNGNPAIENAAVYLQGTQSNHTIKGNDIVANGDGGLSSEYGATVSNILIDGNIFSGQTYTGANPGGVGFGSQFSTSNVPRQLVVMGGGTGGGNTSDITFTNNEVTGSAGGTSTDDNTSPQGNTLVTLDAKGAVITGNTFHGTTTRYGSSLRTRGTNTLISGNTFFADGLTDTNSHLYINNQSGIYSGSNVDGVQADIMDIWNSNTFEGRATVTDSDLSASEDYITLKVQDAVNFSNAGANVFANAGTYEEQVVINKDLTLNGANAGIDPNTGVRGAETIIKSPVALANGFVTSATNKPVVYVDGANNVVIDGVEVDGAGRGNSNYRFMGIGYHNAGGEVKNSIVHGITDTPFSGNQHGNAIYAYVDNAGTYNLDVTNNEVYDFQKNGITLNGVGLSGTVSGNTITGIGATNITAQNGIQIGFGAGGTVDNNTISGIGYSPSTWAAASILVYDAADGVQITNNNITGTGYDLGIYVDGANATVSGNAIDGSADGIDIYADGATVSGNHLSNITVDGIYVDGVNDVTVSGNDITNTGEDAIQIANVTGSALVDSNMIDDAGVNGIFSDASDNVVISNNMVTNTIWDNIAVIGGSNLTINNNEVSGTAAHAGIALNNVNGASITENKISNAGYGLYASNNTSNFSAHGNSVTDITNNLVWNNGASGTFDASGNYWGTTDEAAIAAKMAGSVDFTPYLTSAVDTDAGTKGFQGDFSDVHVTLLGAQTGSTGRVQEGIDVVDAKGTVNVNAGTYAEGNIEINKAVTVKGAGKKKTFIDATGYNTGFFLDDDLGNANVTLSRMSVDNATNVGFLVNGNAGLKNLTVNNAAFNNNGNNGVAVYGNGVKNVRIQNSDFKNNGTNATANLGQGDILLYEFDQNARIKNVTVEGNTGDYNYGGWKGVAPTADYGIQISGTNTVPSGNIVLDNVKVSGNYRAALLGVQKYDGANISFNDVVLGGQTSDGTDSAVTFGSLYLSELGGANIDIGNTSFLAIDDNTPSVLGQYIAVGVEEGSPDVDARNASFEGVIGNTATIEQSFAIEDKIEHDMDRDDTPFVGHVTWNDLGSFVTSNTLGIQHAIDVANAGGTVNVDDSTYTEDLTINKALKLTGHGTTLQSAGGANLITVTADDVNIDPFAFVGDGVTTLYGINATGANNLVVDGNSFTGFVTSAINVADSSGVWIKGNAIDASTSGISADNTADIKISDNTITGTTVNGIHVNHTNGTGYAGGQNDADIWGNTITSASGTGILVENSNFATIGADALNPFASGYAGGNKVSGGNAGIVVNNSNNAQVIYSTVDDINGNGIAISGGTNAKVLNNKVGTVGGVDNIHGDGILANGVNGVVISGNTVTETTGPGAIELLNTNGATIGGVTLADGNTITNSNNDGIRLQDDSNVTVQNNSIDGTGRVGIWGGWVNTASILDNVVNHDNLGGYGSIHADFGSNWTVSGNNVDNGDYGIRLNSVGGTNLVSGNQVDNVSQDAIYANDTSNLTVSDNHIGDNGGNIGHNGVNIRGGSNLSVTNNNIYYVATNGIDVQNVGTKVWIDGNNIDADKASNSPADGNYGIYVSGSHNVTIGDGVYSGNNGNTIDDFATGIFAGSNTGFVTIDANDITDANYGIYTASNPNLKIFDNFVDGRTNSGKGSVGIFVSDSYDAQVGGYDDGNTVEDFNTGIQVSNSTTADVEYNHVHEFTLDGIKVSDSNYVDVKNNEVHNGSGNGIFVQDSDNAEVNTNTVYDVTGTGIFVDPSDYVDIAHNTVSNISGDGILLQDGQNGQIWDNHLNNIGYDGIQVDRNNNVQIWDNDIYNTGDNGIEVSDSYDADISYNEIDETDGNAIYVSNARYADIYGNEINMNHSGANTLENGIYVRNSANVVINNNHIDDINQAGVRLYNTDNVAVRDNDVTDADTGIELADSGINGANIDNNVIRNVENGIWAKDVSNLVITDNNIDARYNVGGKGDVGIYVEDSYNAQIGGYNDGNTVEDFDVGIRVIDSGSADVEYNDVSEFSDYGIWVSNSDYVDVKHNDVYDGAGTAIRVYNSDNAEINDNDIDDVDSHGIEVVNSHYVDIFDNEIDNVGDHGIYVDPSNYVEIAHNTIHNAGWDGIYVDGGHDAHIWDNHIGNVAFDGIDVDNNDDVRIWDNYVHDADDNGIEVSNSDRARITDNEITAAGNDGINVDGGIFARIEDNTVHGEDQGGFLAIGDNGAGRDGIHVYNNYGVDIINNRILGGDGTGFLTVGGAGAGRHGIFVDGSAYADVNGNTIEAGNGGLLSAGGEGAGDDGIHIEDSRGTDVFGNLIDGVSGDGIDVDTSRDTEIGFNRVRVTGENGIEATNSRDVDIFGNIVTLTSEDGIYVGNSRGANVMYNLVAFTGDDGIDVENSRWADVNYNLVAFASENGIEVQNSDHADINGNYVRYTGDNGIYVNPSSHVRITGNTVDDTADDGIDVNGGHDILISGNFIGTTSGNIGDDGIDVDGSDDVTISNNQITAASQAGIELTNTDIVNVLFNNIYDNGQFGLWGRGANNTNIVVSGNTFTDQDIHAQFESGLIDLTGDSNTFTGGRVGMRFAPYAGVAPMSLVDDDGAGGFGGTIGAQIFDGQSQFYVELDDGAFFDPGAPTLLNALNSTFKNTPFGDFTPTVDYAPGFPLDVVAFLESKFYHFNDDTSLGLFFFPLLPTINQEDIFNYPGANAAALAGLNVTILGLPGLPGNPVAVANITPFAGGDEAGSPAALNAIETAAGGEEAGCWGDAMNIASGGGAVNFSYGGSAADLLNSEAGCGS